MHAVIKKLSIEKIFVFVGVVIVYEVEPQRDLKQLIRFVALDNSTISL